MSQQLSLFPPDKSTDQMNRLFVGIVPDDFPARDIKLLIDWLKRQHGALGTPVGADRPHITLALIDDFRGEIPSRIIQAASHACGKAAAFPAFPVCLDHVVTYKGKPANRPLVTTVADNPALLEFQQSLMIELMRNGLRCGNSPKFNPHLTLFRGAKEIPLQSVDPITWTVREIVLIRSVIGESRYEHLGRWSLGE